MSETTLTRDALIAMTEAEARVRGQLAGSSLFRAAERALESIRAEGATVTLGRLDVLHGAIVERFAHAEGTWSLVHATDVFATLLVHGGIDAVSALAERVVNVPDVRVEALGAGDARARLRAGARVALLPIEIASGASRTQLRVFAFPDAVRAKRTSVRSALADAIDTEVALVCGFSWLRLAELRSLRVGDAVALDHVVPTGTFVGVAKGAMRALDLRQVEGNVNFEGRSTRPRPPNVQLESAMNRDEIPLEAIDDVEVELTLDVGSVRLALSDLATLEPGAVLMPDVGETDRVTLRANGRAIGRGTLVRVEGTLAVRIDALAGGASETPQ